MESIITQMLELFGLSVVPTNFPDFIHWFFSLLCGVYFCIFVVKLSFDFVRQMANLVR